MTIGNTYFVATTGTPYTTVQSAVSDINAGPAPTVTNPAVIYVYPGTYVSSAPIILPQYTSVVGIVKHAWGGVRFSNDTTDVFQCSGFNTFQNLTFVQGATASTWAVNVGNNTDVSVLDCAMYTLAGPGQQQGLLSANGNLWARITVQDCIVNSLQTAGAVISLINTTTAVRFCDTWIRNCFLDMYQLTGFGFAILTSGVQDVRIESGCTLRGSGSASNLFTGVYLAKGAITSGTPQVEVRHCYIGGNSVGVFNEAGTVMSILNSDVAGALTSGTQTVHNSYTGAHYNALPI